uniref:Uncharacterized protein n=1 Tax=Ditylenchus dipsaci TaxID=166011 RepID=A0A915D1V0_9BILA
MPSEAWPKPECRYLPKETVSRGTPQITLAAGKTPEQPAIIDEGRLSSWGKTKRITDYVVKFLRKQLIGLVNTENSFAVELQGHPRLEYLNIPELRTAENLLL